MNLEIGNLARPLAAASALAVLCSAAVAGAQAGPDPTGLAPAKPAAPVATGEATATAAPVATTAPAATTAPVATTAPAAPVVPPAAPVLGTLRDVLQDARRLRCQTAICWGGSGTEWAIEPLVELPIGKTFALPGTRGGKSTTLGRWIDTHDLTVSFAGGLRFWALDDLVSLSVYFSQPLTSSTGYIHVPGSDFDYPVSNIRRPYPGVALGLFGDMVWIGLDYQELINGDARGNLDPNYAPSAFVSNSLSLTIGLATVSSLRWGIGTVATKKVERVHAQDLKAADGLAKDAEEAATAAGEAAKECEQPTATAETSAKAVAAAVGDAAKLAQAKVDLKAAASCMRIARAEVAAATAKAANARTTAATARKDAAEALMKDEESAATKIEDAIIATADKAKAARKAVEALEKRLGAAQTLLIQ